MRYPQRKEAGGCLTIAVVLFTYDRYNYALRTLELAARHLKASEDIWLHIADDGSPAQDYRDRLLASAHVWYGDKVSITNAERAGYGGSYNLATQVVHPIADLMLPLEDDWWMMGDLDLDPIAAVIRDGTFGCVRLGYIGFTQELRARFVSAHDMLWLHLDPNSPEPHVWAGHPRLEHRDWQRAVGPWPERMAAGATEFEVAHRPEARERVAWPVSILRPGGDAFVHVGTEKAVYA